MEYAVMFLWNLLSGVHQSIKRCLVGWLLFIKNMRNWSGPLLWSHLDYTFCLENVQTCTRMYKFKKHCTKRGTTSLLKMFNDYILNICSSSGQPWSCRRGWEKTLGQGCFCLYTYTAVVRTCVFIREYTAILILGTSLTVFVTTDTHTRQWNKSAAHCNITWFGLCASKCLNLWAGPVQSGTLGPVVQRVDNWLC